MNRRALSADRLPTTKLRGALLIDVQACLFLAYERPLLIELQMGQRKPLHASIQEPTAGVAEEHNQLTDCVAVKSGNAFGRADRIAFDK